MGIPYLAVRRAASARRSAPREFVEHAYCFKAFPSCEQGKAFDDDPLLVRLEWRHKHERVQRIDGDAHAARVAASTRSPTFRCASSCAWSTRRARTAEQRHGAARGAGRVAAALPAPALRRHLGRGDRGLRESSASGIIERLWFATCLAALAVLVGARAMHFLAAPLPAPLEEAVGEILRFEFRAFLSAFLAGGVLALALVASLLLLLVRFRWCVAREGARWRLRPWLSALLWGGVVAMNFLLDMNLDLAWLFAVTLPLVWIAFAPALHRQRSGIRVATVWVLVWATWFALSPTLAAGALGVPWLAAAALASGFGPGLLRGRDAIGVLLAFGAALQLVAILPGAIPGALLSHGGTTLGEGRVYSFCEVPGGETLLAIITSCEGSDVESCRDDHLVAYDRAAFSRRRELSLFDADFYGRMLHLLCFEDLVLVGMSFTRIDRESFAENVMAFDPDLPALRTRRLLPERTGHRDAARSQCIDDLLRQRVLGPGRLERRHAGDTERGSFRVGVPDDQQPILPTPSRRAPSRPRSTRIPRAVAASSSPSGSPAGASSRSTATRCAREIPSTSTTEVSTLWLSRSPTIG